MNILSDRVGILTCLHCCSILEKGHYFEILSGPHYFSNKESKEGYSGQFVCLYRHLKDCAALLLKTIHKVLVLVTCVVWYSLRP